MRLLNRQRILPTVLLLCISFLLITPCMGAANQSRTDSSEEKFFYKPSKSDSSSGKSGTSSSIFGQPGTATTNRKKAKTAATTEKGMMEKTALATGSVLCSALYTPAKALYAAGGTLTGSMVYLMSAGQSTTAAGNIISRSTHGDWFVRPSHLSGERHLRFDAVQEETKKGWTTRKKK